MLGGPNAYAECRGRFGVVGPITVVYPGARAERLGEHEDYFTFGEPLRRWNDVAREYDPPFLR